MIVPQFSFFMIGHDVISEKLELRQNIYRQFFFEKNTRKNHFSVFYLLSGYQKILDSRFVTYYDRESRYLVSKRVAQFFM